MRTRITIAVLLTAAGTAFGAGAASAADPLATVQADVTTLQADIAAARDGVVADLAKLAADAASLKGTSDRAAARATIRADLQKLRADRRSLHAKIRADRSQLRADVAAAKTANADLGALKQLVKDTRTKARAAVRDVLHAARDARIAVRELRRSFR